ncbi:MAG: thymidylate synthase [Rickettsiales bacterium]|nr:thymidylate synthase [Rickettsiales bacterium]
MKAYLDIIREIKDFARKPDGTYDWAPNRTGIPTIGIPGAMFRHDMAHGFPLVTTKKMGMKSILAELEFFIHGITDKKWLQDRNCKIWNEWATARKVKPAIEKYRAEHGGEISDEIKNKIAAEEPDLGPIYGFQWRHFGAEYDFDNYATKNFKTDGVDQVQKVIDMLHANPDDRRMIVSAWNPAAFPDQALPPCHFAHHVVVKGGKLNLIWFQRSWDIFLGGPYNIASYAMLLKLYAKEGGFEEGILTGFSSDTHIYRNHMPQIEEQLSREPRPLPTVEIPDDNWKGMLNWTASDVVLKDYDPYDSIKAEVAI